MSIFFDGLKGPLLKMNVATIPDEELNIEVLDNSSEENQEMITLKTDEETLGAK